MDRLLARLERRFGKYAVENLTFVIVGGMAAVYLLWMVRPEFEELLRLDLDLIIHHGQVWRLFTFLFIPRTHSILWIIFSLSFVWMLGTNLEGEWGAFKFNVFYGMGMLGTVIGAALTTGRAGNTFLNMSLLLAFATLYPDYEINLIIIPVKAKWLAWFDAAGLAYALVTGGWSTRAAVIAAFANYLLFFRGELWGIWRGRNLQVRQAARRASAGPAVKATGGRVCAICGASEDDGADIRVCSCDKCGGPRTLCLEHARNH
jgi:hypothetical protein